MKEFVILLLFLAFLAASFKSEFFPGDGRFYVRHVEEHATGTRYQLIQVTGNGQTWVIAKSGCYHIGDTLTLQAKPAK